MSPQTPRENSTPQALLAAAGCDIALLVLGLAFAWGAAEAMIVYFVDTLLILAGGAVRVFFWTAKRRFASETHVPFMLAISLVPASVLMMYGPFAAYSAATSDPQTFGNHFPLHWIIWLSAHFREQPALWLSAGILVAMHAFVFVALFLRAHEWHTFDLETYAKRPLVHMLLLFLFFTIGLFVIDRVQTMGLGLTLVPITILVLFKTGIDIAMVAWNIRVVRHLIVP